MSGSIMSRRILYVAHGFPPDQMAGAEVYTWAIAREVARRGHAVTVLAPAPRPGHRELALVEEFVDGVRVLRLNQNNRGLDRLRKTYRDPDVDRIFADLLGRERPDVVHVQHTIGVSAGVLAVARDAGVPLVFTLHDYWFQCPRGQRLTPGMHLCETIQPMRCAVCVGRKRGAYGVRWLGMAARGTAGETAGEGAIERALKFLPRAVRYAAREAWTAPILRRTEEMRELIGAADLLIAPSQHLLERFVEWGVPREKLVFSEYGMDDAPFRALPPREPRDPAARPVRFGFVGTLMASKGPDLVVRAFQGLPHGAATMELFGAPSGPGAAAFEAHLRALNRHPDLAFRGRFDNRRIAEILSRLDVLIVPSRWWENAPLTIHESVMARMPLVTSGHGGMAELAERFGNAVLFQPDDADDLERALRRFLDEPGIWEELRPKREVRSVADDVDFLLARYDDLTAARAAAGIRGPRRP
ncbi:MAG TPA: glycosyltransferase family 4 protein [Planctomycetota bacterium]|nr:glycosyltransferase family 4 protein [Planctomycetota bacterium]